MTKRLSIWGIGANLALVSALYGAAALAATFLWPEIFAVRGLPYACFLVPGVVLIVVGLPIYALSVRTLVKAFGQKRLVTTGVYAVCRNPIYAVWIVLLVPAIALLTRSWPVLTLSLLMYVIVRVQGRREEENLEALFGQEYVEYKRRVNAVFPTLWWRK